MLFKYNPLPSLEVGKTYLGKISSVRVINEDSEDERILINVDVEGFMSPAPASYQSNNETGSRLFNELLSSLGYKESDGDIIEFLKDKEVKVKVKETEEYINTTISVNKGKKEESKDNVNLKGLA